MEMRRGIVRGATALALVALATGSALAEQVTASQLAVVALDATYQDAKGKVEKLSASYENLYWRFVPMSNEPRTVDIDGDFVLAGPAPGLIGNDCPREKGGRIFYPSGGASSDSYRCDDAVVQTQGSLTRKGGTWTFQGRLDGTMQVGPTTEQWTLTESFVLKIVGDRCSVVKASRVRTVVKDTGKTVSRVVSGPRAKCAFM